MKVKKSTAVEGNNNSSSSLMWVTDLLMALAYGMSLVVLMILVLIKANMRAQAHMPVVISKLYTVDPNITNMTLLSSIDFVYSQNVFMRYVRVSFYPVMYLQLGAPAVGTLLHVIYFVYGLGENQGKAPFWHRDLYIKALSYPWKWIVFAIMLTLSAPGISTIIGFNTLGENFLVTMYL